MKTLYFDCFSGISGDMTIGALLDLGLDLGYLKAELKKLPVEAYELRVSRVLRSNLSATKFDVVMEDVETLNRFAPETKLDITKLSYAAYENVMNEYVLLDAHG